LFNYNFSDGQYITNGNGKCLGVKGRRIEAVRCNRNEISLRWLWTGIGNIMNLKTLKCLQWNKASNEFTTEQCKSMEITQIWTAKDERVTLNDRTFKPEPLYVNYTIRISSHEGK
jgi:transcription antitermination factor NusA-like protein